MGHGGLFDGTPRLSRDGEPVYHYSLLSTFADHAVVAERSCLPIPDDVPFDVASLVGCAIATGVGAVWRTAGVRPGDRVCVIGCGGVGLSALLAAAAVGAEPDRRRRSRRGEARGGGRARRDGHGPWAGDADATAELVREASGGGVDYAIEATGRPDAATCRVPLRRARGAAVLVGIPRADASVSFPALQIPRTERRILGSIYGSSKPERDFPPILALYRSGRLPLDRLISHRLPARGGRRGVRPDVVRGLRSAWSSTSTERNSMDDPLDGRIGEGWSGEAPNGSHINVVVARRGSVTAAALAGALASPRPGHLPFLACLELGTLVRPTTSSSTSRRSRARRCRR